MKQKKSKLFNDEQMQFIFDNYKGMLAKDLTKLLNEKFDTNFTYTQVCDFKKRNKLKSGVKTTFKDGHTPFNKGLKWDEYLDKDIQEVCLKAILDNRWHKGYREKQVGSIKQAKDGKYWYKQSMRGKDWGEKWIPLANKVYEDHFGKIEEGSVIIHLDGDVSNDDIDNLKMINRRELAYLNLNSGVNKDKDVTLVNIGITKLDLAILDKKKK